MDQGLHRFFRRLGERRFDEDDLRVRAAELAEWVRKTAPVPPIAVGYSNGANIAAGLLLLHPGTLRGAMLFRPTVPLVPEHSPDLHGVDVLLVPAEDDPLSPLTHVTRLAALLRQAGGSVTVSWQHEGHGLTPEDVTTAREWLQDHFSNRPSPVAGEVREWDP
jgi:predicted esterase